MARRDIAEQLKEFRTLIANSRNHSGINQALTDFGYPLQNLEKGQALLEKFTMLHSLKSDQYGAKLNATDTVRADLQQLKNIFNEHLTLARLAFKEDRGLQNTLKLNTPLPGRRSAFIEQAAHFYSKVILHHNSLKRYGVTKAELEQAQVMVTALIQSQQQQAQKTGEAQSATQQCNLALKELQVWVRGYKAIVRLALGNDPQLLEIVGILVKV
ncbi:hypothetical protein [Catalinimonas niigatensis]|uniref:hypothetical protein n=1 Tax=Catalinimonas niigatensis TaxID=1397264 RepID=UPI002666CAA6|nr:hypothetical protein [Catalinimonas niigatensis]WPP52360.1 hypothetical protein PZB72_08195 [Catalinimonas niigatensis]